MTPLAAMATFSIPIAQIAMALGENAKPFLYVFLNGLDQVFLPYEFVNYLLMFSFGVVTTKQFLSFFSLKMVLNIAYILIIVLPYWKIIGLL